MVISLVLSLICIVSLSHRVNQHRIYSIQQFTAFFTQSPNLRTADFDSAGLRRAYLAYHQVLRHVPQPHNVHRVCPGASHLQLHRAMRRG